MKRASDQENTEGANSKKQKLTEEMQEAIAQAVVEAFKKADGEALKKADGERAVSSPRVEWMRPPQGFVSKAEWESLSDENEHLKRKIAHLRNVDDENEHLKKENSHLRNVTENLSRNPSRVPEKSCCSPFNTGFILCFCICIVSYLFCWRFMFPTPVSTIPWAVQFYKLTLEPNSETLLTHACMQQYIPVCKKTLDERKEEVKMLCEAIHNGSKIDEQKFLIWHNTGYMDQNPLSWKIIGNKVYTGASEFVKEIFFDKPQENVAPHVITPPQIVVPAPVASPVYAPAPAPVAPPVYAPAPAPVASPVYSRNDVIVNDDEVVY